MGRKYLSKSLGTICQAGRWEVNTLRRKSLCDRETVSKKGLHRPAGLIKGEDSGGERG